MAPTPVKNKFLGGATIEANVVHFVFDAETVVVHMQVQGIGRHDHRPVCPGIDEERYVTADVEAGDD